MPRRHKPLTRRKLDQIEQRRYTVANHRLWGFKQTHTARLLKVSVKTVARDIEVIKTWPDTHEATFEEFRRELREKINDLGRIMRISLSEIEEPEKRIRLARVLMDPLIEMWKKLMPTEIKFEGFMQPPLGTDFILNQQEELSKRAPKSKSAELIRKRIKDRASQ